MSIKINIIFLHWSVCSQVCRVCFESSLLGLLGIIDGHTEDPLVSRHGNQKLFIIEYFFYLTNKVLTSLKFLLKASRTFKINENDIDKNALVPLVRYVVHGIVV